MPVTVNCGCGKQLRVDDEHAGKRIRCPGCGAPVLVASPDARPPASTAAGMVTFACGCGKKMQARAEHAGKTVKCPDCSKGVLVPTSERSGTTDRRSAPRADDRAADDRRPSSRRREEPEEEEYVPPSKRRKQRGSGLWWLLTACVLLLVGGGVLAWFLFLSGGGADLSLVPADATAFASVRVADLLASEPGKEALAGMPDNLKAARKEFEAKVGVGLADLERVTVVVPQLPLEGMVAALTGGKGDAGPPGDPLEAFYCVCTFSKPLDAAKVLDLPFLKGATATDYNGKKYHARGQGTLYFHDAKTLVVAREAGIKKAIDQAVRPKSDGALRSVLGRVGKQQLSLGGALPAEMKAAMQALAQFGGENKGVTALGDLQDVLLAGSIKGKAFEFDLNVAFHASTSAGAVKDELEKFVQEAGGMVDGLPPAQKKPAKEVLAALKTSVSGSTLSVASRVTVPSKMLADLLQGIPVPSLGEGEGGGADLARQSQENLRKLAQGLLAMDKAEGGLKYAIRKPGTFPPQPLLSWRVAVLPYIGEKALFDEIKKDEDWNGPHNSKLHDRMPDVFKMPGKTSASGTNYQVFRNGGAIFSTTRPTTRTADITDGSSNTILIAEGVRSVNWMKPDDIEVVKVGGGFDPAGRVGGGPVRDKFHVAMADGSVRTLPLALDPKTFLGAITAAGGEPIQLP